jgi:hypothetical protein
MHLCGNPVRGDVRALRARGTPCTAFHGLPLRGGYPHPSVLAKLSHQRQHVRVELFSLRLGGLRATLTPTLGCEIARARIRAPRSRPAIPTLQDTPESARYG